MNNIINKIMSEIPKEWKRISKENYIMSKIYISEEYEIIAAYDVSGELLTINNYPEIEGFIEAYHEQIEEIKKIINKKNWKEISVINPIKNKFLKNNEEEKLYISVFETYNSEEKTSIQIFYQDKQNTIGLFTFISKEPNKDIWESVKQHPTVKKILSFFYKKSAK